MSIEENDSILAELKIAYQENYISVKYPATPTPEHFVILTKTLQANPPKGKCNLLIDCSIPFDPGSDPITMSQIYNTQETFDNLGQIIGEGWIVSVGAPRHVQLTLGIIAQACGKKRIKHEDDDISAKNFIASQTVDPIDPPPEA